MPRRPLDAEIAAVRRERDEADRKLRILLEAQRALLEETIAAERASQHDSLHSAPARPNIASTMLGQVEDSRALKISKTRTGKRRAPEVIALHEAGLTPHSAAVLCETTRDVLKQAWAKGKQFREIRPEWKERLAKAGVPRSIWRTR